MRSSSSEDPVCESTASRTPCGAFTGINDILPQRCAQTPLGILTVAALTPPDFDVELQDENVRPLKFDTDADVVAIACWSIQYGRARHIAEAFRKRGKMVVAGGPYPSLCPERFTDGLFDVVFDGEVEITWPQFCDDLRTGTYKPLYKQEGNVDISLSPVPRVDLASRDDYLYYFLQTTRGCPFKCEFCDIIITDGRVPRTKSVEQVLTEIETVRSVGGIHISFSDANLIGNMRYAEELLTAVAEYGRENSYPINFSAEMTINVAEKPKLLQLLHDANFTSSSWHRVATARRLQRDPEAAEHHLAADGRDPQDPVHNIGDPGGHDRRVRQRRQRHLQGAVRFSPGSGHRFYHQRRADGDREDAPLRAPGEEGRLIPTTPGR